MFEKVNPKHPDKVADRIAGAIVDLAYTKNNNPKVAAEVLIGHGKCFVTLETSEDITHDEVLAIVKRITEDNYIQLTLVAAPQDKHLAGNQASEIRCGDNGIFKGVPVTSEEAELSKLARLIYSHHSHDGKYIFDAEQGKLIVCQSNATNAELQKILPEGAVINPLGEWTGGTNVDSGATNRKLGSDMAQSVTGGGLHGKDLSKADVSVNIYAFIQAQKTGKTKTICCAIGDNEIDGHPYSEIVEIARAYIQNKGGFEKFAEWGLV